LFDAGHERTLGVAEALALVLMLDDDWETTVDVDMRLLETEVDTEVVDTEELPDELPGLASFAPET
jgi:hypothetical protein